MKKTLLSVFFFVIGFGIAILPTDVPFLEKQQHRNAVRAGILISTTLEVLAINSKMELLGIAQANRNFSPSKYIAHNVANACPTCAGWFNIDVTSYTSQGPVVIATPFDPNGPVNIPVLIAMSGLFAQNYYLTQKLYMADYPALESLFLTIGGFFLAWTVRLGLGLSNCN